MSGQDTETSSLTIERLTEIGQAATTLLESGVLEPHEKTHLWQVIERIDGMTADAQNRSQPAG